jgi:hypothetical protein
MSAAPSGILGLGWARNPELAPWAGQSSPFQGEPVPSTGAPQEIAPSRAAVSISPFADRRTGEERERRAALTKCQPISTAPKSHAPDDVSGASTVYLPPELPASRKMLAIAKATPRSLRAETGSPRKRMPRSAPPTMKVP